MLAKPHNQVYIGHNSSTTTVALYLLSSSELLSANWSDEGNNFVQTTQCATSTVNTNFHGTLVDVSGYVCNLSIIETEKRIFQNYSVTVSNDCCSNTFKFSIKSASKIYLFFICVYLFIYLFSYLQNCTCCSILVKI